MVKRKTSVTAAHRAIPPFEAFLFEGHKTQSYIDAKLAALPEWTAWVEQEYQRESQTTAKKAYPSQGLLTTPYDSDRIVRSLDKVEKLPQQIFTLAVTAGVYYLELLNHPERLKSLFKVQAQPFIPPQALEKRHPLFADAEAERLALSINELALEARGDAQPRAKRRQRLLEGPFVKLGLQARSCLCGSANPECWGAAPAIAAMAQAHSLVGVPRDGVFVDPKRQAALAAQAFEWLDRSPVLVGRTPTDRAELLKLWRHNVMGILEVEPEAALERAKKLYKVGIRTFRAYSPEPGSDLVETITLLRKYQKQHRWEEIEIFGGQVINVRQALAVEAAGANGLYLGIGGGGRCITGVRSGLAINWPQLLEKLRGIIKIPVIVEGGASDYIAQTLAVGATGIGVTRSVAGGTIESPGGWSFFHDDSGWFKPYGGEASARVKYLGGKSGPYDIIPYLEGQTTEAYMNYGRGVIPTLLHNFYLLNGDVILGMVFQNAATVAEFQDVAFRSIVHVSPMELTLRQTH